MSESTVAERKEEQAGSPGSGRPPKSDLQRRIEQALIHVLGLILLHLTRYAGIGSMRRLARMIAWITHKMAPRRVRMAEANIRAAFGDKYTPQEVSRICYLSGVNILQTIAELLKVPWMSEEQVREWVSLKGRENLDEALARGNGVIIVTAHFGNWEWVGALLCLEGYTLSVVARDANDPLMASIINGAREAGGLTVYGRKDTRKLLRALKNNELVGILPDQHATDGAVLCTFLGRPAATHSGPAMLALRTGAAIVPFFGVRRPDNKIETILFPALDIKPTGDRQADVLSITQQLNDIIGEQIHAHPEQWLWLHNRWKVPNDTDASGD